MWITRRKGNDINASSETRRTNIPGSVATTDAISIHCGLIFNAITTSGSAIETASNQDTYIAHKINNGGATQRKWKRSRANEREIHAASRADVRQRPVPGERARSFCEPAAGLTLARFKEPGVDPHYKWPFDAALIEDELMELYLIEMFEEIMTPAPSAGGLILERCASSTPRRATSCAPGSKGPCGKT